MVISRTTPKFAGLAAVQYLQGSLNWEENRQLSDAKWLCDLGFLCDISEQLNNLNVKLQGCKQVITEMYDCVKALQLNLHVWEKHLIPSTHSQAVRVMSMFGSTYFCKQLFSLMKIYKSAQKSRLNDKHLHSVLKIVSAQNMNPDIDKLVSRNRCQISSVNEHAQGSN
ncbi:GT2D2 protein, partial [Polyodon spathula]|nr:GT2D2 protein [Polyodon spathula]